MPTATPFNNLITFSRGSNATVTGPNGLIQWAPNNVLTHSEQFDNATWVKGGVSITANNAVAPDGTTTADLLTGTGATPRVYQLATLVSGVSYTATCYVKQGTSTSIGFDAININAGPVFTFATRTWSALPAQFTAASFQELADGWFRLIITFTNNTTSAGPGWYVSGNTTAWLWGAQLELGSTATTYNPTTVKNLLGFSEALDNPAWTKGNASIVTGAQANPINNLFNAQKLMENTANAEHSCRQSVSGLIANTPITVSVYLKAAERTIARVLNLDGANFYGIFVDLSNGSFISTSTSGTFSNGSYSIASVGSGWFRVSVTATIAGTARSLYINTGVSGPSASYVGDGNSGVYIYGAQLSDSASLDPYVPTPGAAPSSTAFYGPRFDYDPVTLQPRGLLVEEQRTNLLLNSVFGGAVSGTPGTAPTSWGSFTNGSIVVTSLGRNFAANSIRITTTSARHFYSQTVALAATGTWIITFKVNVGTAVRIDELLAFNTLPAGSTIQYFYNDAAQVASYVPPTGNGVLQVTVTTTGTSGNAEIRFGCGASNAVTAEVTFWDAQWELGAFATSYIPTVASTVTRSADVATITGQNFAQWYRQPEGTLVAEFSGPSGGYPLNMTDGTTNNATGIVYVGATTLRGISVVSGAGRFVDMAANAAPAVNKTSYGYRLNDLGGSTNNGAVVANTTAPIPVLDRMFVGTFSNFSFLNGHIRNIRFIPARAADFQLQALST